MIFVFFGNLISQHFRRCLFSEALRLHRLILHLFSATVNAHSSHLPYIDFIWKVGKKKNLGNQPIWSCAMFSFVQKKKHLTKYRPG